MDAPPPQTLQDHPAPTFKKSLNSLDAFALGFGAMIGFGWVVLTGSWIEDAGTLGAVVALVAGGLIMAVVGLVYGELTAAMPKSGGEHHFLLRGMGARWSFFGSWGITGGYISVVAFEAVALPRTVAYIWPDVGQVHLWTLFGSEVTLTWALIGSVAAVVIAAINYVGVKTASLAQTFVVLFLVLVGALLLFGSATQGTVENMQPLFTGWGGVFTVMIVVPFMFVGFDVIPQAAEELDMPPNRMGRLIVGSVLMATLWYAMVTLTTSSALSGAELAEADLATADAMGALFGSRIMANILIAGGIAGILTSWIAMLIGASRLMQAMGQVGMLPRWFATVHPRYRTPSNAILFIGALSALAPFMGASAIGWLVDSGSPSVVITYLMVCVVFLILRRREPGMPRPFMAGRGGLGMLVGVAGVVLTAGLVLLYVPGMPASIHPVSYALFLAWWVLGLIFLFRIPAGIRGGEDADERLHEALAARGR